MALVQIVLAFLAPFFLLGAGNVSQDAEGYCVQEGGVAHVRASEDFEITLCRFENGTECEIEEFFNGDCVKESDAGERFSDYDAEVEKVLDQELCTEKSDCELPMEYALMSRCPFDVRCLENKCMVVCPDF